MARTLMNTSHRSGDPSPGLGDGGEQSVPVFGPHPGSMQGALMMPFTAAKVGAVQGSASGGAEPCVLCCGMSIWKVLLRFQGGKGASDVYPCWDNLGGCGSFMALDRVA